jgi:aquaporin Z
MDSNLRAYLAEGIGTFILVFLGAGVVCSSKLAEMSGHSQPYLVGIALAQGFVLAAALSATVNVSGGYLNPAVTLLLWVFKRLDGSRALGLAVAQLLGAVAAGGVLRFTYSERVLEAVRMGVPPLNTEAFSGAAGVPPALPILLSGIGIELVLTFILTFAIFGTTVDPRAPRLGGLGVGLALVAVILVGFPLTGAAANPARWLGPALWEATAAGGRAFLDHLVYWAGPVLGALLAGAVYEFLILPADEKARPVEEATHARRK